MKLVRAIVPSSKLDEGGRAFTSVWILPGQAIRTDERGADAG